MTAMLPPRKILAPVDFSDASRASLQCAARLANQWNAELHVVHALDPLLATAAGAQGLDVTTSAREEFAEFVAGAGTGRAPAPALHLLVGAAATAICDTAAKLGADLIVVGARGLSGLNRLMMGTTTEHVIRRAQTSVLTVPGRWPGDSASAWGPVIAAIDNVADPDGVARAATTLASSLGAALHAVHVVPALGVTARWKAAAEAAQHARVDDARRQLIGSMAALGGPPADNIHVTSGAVADALAAEASRHTASLPVLVLGRAAPGQGPAPGAVASRVIARATAAVWMYLPDR
jgi:nucleotide-binding universal stress UspA family protein